MTPIPKPQPALRRLNPKLHVPVTAAQKALLARRRAAPTRPPSDDWIAAQLAHSQGRPYPGDTIEAAAGGEVEDEIDAGYLAAVRKAPRVAGNEPGQVPMAVAHRLYDAGLVRRVEK